MANFPAGFTLLESPDLTAATRGVLADLAQLAPGPFDSPSVLVRHPAVRRHLTLAIARELGVAASLDFPAPLQLLHRLQGTPRNDPWQRDALGWRIAATLPALLDRLPDTIARITGDPDLFVRTGFAQRLAARLHDAVHHRPEMLLAWEAHGTALRDAPDEAWQAELWRHLVAGTSIPSPVARHRAWCDALTARSTAEPEWPLTLLVVSDPTLSPMLRQALHAVSRVVAVRWYCLVSGPDALDPERPKRRPAALAALRALPEITITAMEAAHGTASRDTLLGAVQQRLGGHPTVPHALRSDDTSLIAHRAHSAVRELESLREQVAWHLGQDPTLAPHDITLYLTDLDAYLPAVDAVFGTAEPGLPPVYYEVAGRPWRTRSTIGAAVTALLDALGGRFARREVLALLDHLPVRIAADLHGAQLLRLRTLVEEVRIRWGLDGDDRATRHGLPALPDGTWRHGLAHLATRYGVIPDLDDDPDALLIQRMTRWIEQLAHWRTQLEVPRPIEAWAPLLDTFLTQMVRPGGSDDAEALGELRGAVHRVIEQVVVAGSGTSLPFAALRPAIAEALDGGATAGQLRGGLRVCRLEAGAVLPARVVLIAGLDDGRFPRGGGTPPWDILLQSRLDNDRDPLEFEDPDPREDTLEAFRDAIRSARDAVHLSWTGRSLMDNALRSPSVAVSELFDLIDHIVPAEGNHHEPHQRIVVDEPLQPFAPGLFRSAAVNGHGRAPLLSAATRWREAAVTVLDPARLVEPFVTAPLPEPPPLTAIMLKELATAFADPPEWFWRSALGLSRPGRDEGEQDREPILPEDDGGLELPSARIKHARQSFPHVVEAIAAEVELPYGALALPTARRREPDLAVAVRTAAAPSSRGPLAVRLDIAGVVIEGQLEQVGADGMLDISPHPLSGKTLLRAWVRHLALNAVVTTPAGCATTLVGVANTSEKVVASFAPVDNAVAHLAELIELFRTLQRRPVACFPRAAVAVAQAMCDGGDLARAARQGWEASFGGSAGDADSPVVQRLYDGRDLDPQRDPELWNEFVDCVTRLVRPMVEHLTLGGAT